MKNLRGCPCIFRCSNVPVKWKDFLLLVVISGPNYLYTHPSLQYCKPIQGCRAHIKMSYILFTLRDKIFLAVFMWEKDFEVYIVNVYKARMTSLGNSTRSFGQSVKSRSFKNKSSDVYDIKAISTKSSECPPYEVIIFFQC